MAPVQLDCPARDCDFKTQLLEYAQAKELLDIHVKVDHRIAGGDNRKPEKFPRPEISLDKSAEDWSEFKVTWDQYKEEYALTGPQLIRQLYACCSEEMKTSLSRITAGQQFRKTEKELLDLMKQLAVRFQNPMVHVQEFLHQVQNQEEGVRSYLTRLRGVAARCNFSETCPDCNKDISYSDSIIRFKLIAGLYDSEIKEDILSLEEKSLDETVKTIEAKESGKLARLTIGAPSAPAKVSSMSSSASRMTSFGVMNPTVASYNISVKCTNCGRFGHSSQREEREKHCPAWDKVCQSCDRKGHFKSVCRMKKKPFVGKQKKVGDATDEENIETARVKIDKKPDIIFDNEKAIDLMSVNFGEVAALRYCMSKINNEVQNVNKVKIPHMVYEQLRWIVSRPQRPPNTRVSVKVDAQSYRDQDIRPPSAFKHRNADLVALADTGCQAVCMGPQQLSQLGLSKCDLMGVQMRLSAANGSGLNILGALFINISGESHLGKVYQTKQLCYVAEGVDKLLLSKEACQKLGMISSKFPEVGAADIEGEAIPINTVNPAEIINDEQFDLEPCSPNEDGTCSCPRRESCPPPPKFDPNLSTSGLRKLLINHYKASAFNRCTRQTLPLMKGEPLPIPTRKDVKPVAVHTPVAIPLHWEKKVHRDLMRDVALGVIEPVPINTPVTWCSRMVVVPKHSGEPRRTVDLQALNRASVRQTHHTRSPFMLASAIPAGKIKSVLDIWNSFHSVPLRLEDRDKTTFITPWGRFRYRVAPPRLPGLDGWVHTQI